MLYRKITYIGLLLLSLFACQNSKCLKGIGEQQKIKKELSFFNDIRVSDNISVVLTEGEEIYVEAGENIIPFLRFEVQDSSLVISNENACDWLRSYEVPVKVYIGSQHLQSITWQSYGSLSTNKNLTISTLQITILDVVASINLDLNAAYLVLFSNSGASVNLKGKADWFSIFTMGYGKIAAKELLAQEAVIKHQGQNDIEITAEEKLSVSIESLGNVYYFGKPKELAISILGDGKVVAP